MARRGRAKGPANIAFVTGDKALDRQLQELAGSAFGMAKRGVNKGLGVLVKEMRRQAPVGENKAVKKSIGKRFEKQKRTNTVVGKAGLNVAKKPADNDGKPKAGAQAPHGPLQVLGTEERVQKKTGRRTGRGPANGFIKRATAAKKGEVVKVIKETIKQQLQKKARRKKR